MNVCVLDGVSSADHHAVAKVDAHMTFPRRIIRSSYNKIVVFIDRSPAECYNSFKVLWIGEAFLPQRRFFGGSNHSFFVEMLIS